jgi:Ca-activated chloride channel family protein
MAEETLYERLGLPRDATQEDIVTAYRDLARRLHPDLHVKQGATDRFLSIQEAYEVLSDPARRSEYDAQLPEQVKRSHPVTVSTHYSRKTLTYSFEPQLIYALVEMNIRKEALSSGRPQLNFCLVIDCSTSMQGARLDTAKETAIELIRQLQPTDILSIVRFSDRSETLLPANHLNNQSSPEMQVQLLHARGGTEIFQGLNLGMFELRRFRHANRINHMIMITDGRTYGDEEKCIQLADQAASLQVGISTFGIGGQWNDNFLDTLTAKTGGSSFYISDARDIRQLLLDKVVGLGDIYANQVTYNFQTPTNIDLSYAFRIHPESSALTLTSPVILGAVPRKNKLAALLEFHVNSIPSGLSQVPLAEGKLSYLTPGIANASTFIQNLDLHRPVSPVIDSSPPPAAIIHAMSYLTLYRMQEKARADIARGDVQSAIRRLQNLATHLLAQGQRELSRQVMSEINHIQQHHSFSTEGEKQIKYGTRSLIPSPARKENEND